jgi:hypothetical protein
MWIFWVLCVYLATMDFLLLQMYYKGWITSSDASSWASLAVSSEFLFWMRLPNFHLSVYQVSVVTSVWAVIRNRSRTQQLSWPLLGFIAMILKSSKTWFWYINTVLKLFGKNQITSQKTINSLLNLQSFWNNWDWWFFDSGFFFFSKKSNQQFSDSKRFK